MAIALADDHPLRAETLWRCQEWLSYQSPARRRLTRDAIAVPAMRYDEVGSCRLPGSFGFGPYRPVLTEAQYHWAARTLPPLLCCAAFARRRLRRMRDVMDCCRECHRREWTRWCIEHPGRPLVVLLQECAVEMALKLGGDLI